MATITPTRENRGSPGNVQVYKWADITENDTCEALLLAHLADKTVQVTGTITTSIDIEGSNDGTNFAIVHDPQGNDLQFTAVGIEAVLENPLFIRPKTPVGASSSVTVVMTVRG